MPYDYLAKSLRASGQLPLDQKRYFLTINQLKDLGIANSKAYDYYEWMKVLCVENGAYYIWQQVDENYQEGLLDNNFKYAPNAISNGVVYSDRWFNFVPETSGVVLNPIGKPFVIYKDWETNKEDYLQVGDVVDGHFNSNLFIRGARYKGGAVNLITSFAIESDFNPKELI